MMTMTGTRCFTRRVPLFDQMPHRNVAPLSHCRGPHAERAGRSHSGEGTHRGSHLVSLPIDRSEMPERSSRTDMKIASGRYPASPTLLHAVWSCEQGCEEGNEKNHQVMGFLLVFYMYSYIFLECLLLLTPRCPKRHLRDEHRRQRCAKDDGDGEIHPPPEEVQL